MELVHILYDVFVQHENTHIIMIFWTGKFYRNCGPISSFWNALFNTFEFN